MASSQTRSSPASRRIVHVWPRSPPSGHSRAHGLQTGPLPGTRRSWRRTRRHAGGPSALTTSTRAALRQLFAHSVGARQRRELCAPARALRVHAFECRTRHGRRDACSWNRFHTSPDAMQHRDRTRSIAEHRGQRMVKTGDRPGALKHCHETDRGSSAALRLMRDASESLVDHEKCDASLHLLLPTRVTPNDLGRGPSFLDGAHVPPQTQRKIPCTAVTRSAAPRIASWCRPWA